jgi:hypothetical protein
MYDGEAVNHARLAWAPLLSLLASCADPPCGASSTRSADGRCVATDAAFDARATDGRAIDDGGLEDSGSASMDASVGPMDSGGEPTDASVEDTTALADAPARDGARRDSGSTDVVTRDASDTGVRDGASSDAATTVDAGVFSFVCGCPIRNGSPPRTTIIARSFCTPCTVGGDLRAFDAFCRRQCDNGIPQACWTRSGCETPR